MAARDPYLAPINRALRDLGSSVSLEVSPSGGRLRLRASLPLPEGGWKQRRITTAFPYPSGIDRAREPAEELGRDLELHRRGLESFPFDRWLQPTKVPGEDSLLSQKAITIDTLRALVHSKPMGSRSRSKAALAATAVAQALAMGSARCRSWRVARACSAPGRPRPLVSIDQPWPACASGACWSV